MKPELLQKLKQKIADKTGRSIDTITDAEVIAENFSQAAAGLCYFQQEITLNIDGLEITVKRDGSEIAEDTKEKVIEEFEKHKAATEDFVGLVTSENAQQVLDALGIYRRVIATESTDEEVRKTKARNDTASALSAFPNLRNLLFQDKDQVTHEFKFKDGVDEKTLESLSIRLAGEFGISQKAVTATKVGARGVLPPIVLSGIKGKGLATASAAAGNSSDSEESKTANFGPRVGKKRRAFAGAMATVDENEEEQQGESPTTSDTAVDQDLEEKKAQLAEAIAKLKEALAKVEGDYHEARMKKAMLYWTPKEVSEANSSKRPEESDVASGDLKKEFRIIAEAVGIVGDVKKENFSSFFAKFEQFFLLSEKENVAVTTKNMLGRETTKDITISEIAEKAEADRPAFFQNSLSADEKKKLQLPAGSLVAQTLHPERFLLLIDLKLKESESISDPTTRKDAVSVLTEKKNALLKDKLPSQRSIRSHQVAEISQQLNLGKITPSDFIEEDQKIISGIAAALASEDPIVYLFKIKKNLEELDALKSDALKPRIKGSFYELNSDRAKHSSNASSERARLKGILGDQEQRIAARMALDNIELIFIDLVNPQLDANIKRNLLNIVSEYELQDKGQFDSPLGYKYDIAFSFKASEPKYQAVLPKPLGSSNLTPLRSDAEALFQSYKKVEQELIKANQLVLSSILGLELYPGVESFDNSDYGPASRSLIRQGISEIRGALKKAGFSEQSVALEDALGSLGTLTREQFFNQISVVLFQAFAPDGKVETCLKEIRKNPDLMQVLKIDTTILDRDETSALIASVFDNPDFKAAKADHEKCLEAVRKRFTKFKNDFDRAQLVEEIAVFNDSLSPIQKMEIYEQATAEVVSRNQEYLVQRIQTKLRRSEDVVAEAPEPPFTLPSSSTASAAATTNSEASGLSERKSFEEQLREIQQALKQSLDVVNNSSEFKYADAVADRLQVESELVLLKLEAARKIKDALKKVALDIEDLRNNSDNPELSEKQTLHQVLVNMSQVVSDKAKFCDQPIEFRLPNELLQQLEKIELKKSEVEKLKVLEDHPELADDLKSAAAAIEETRKNHALFQVFRKNIEKLSALIARNSGDVSSAESRLEESKKKILDLVFGSLAVDSFSDFSNQKMSEIDNLFKSKISEQERQLISEEKKMELAIRAKIQEREAGTSNHSRAAASAAAAAETTQRSESESSRKLSQRNRELEVKVSKLQQELSGNQRVNQSSQLSKGSSRQQTASRPSNERKIKAVRDYDEENRPPNRKNPKSVVKGAVIDYYKDKNAKPSSAFKPTGETKLDEIRSWLASYYSYKNSDRGGSGTNIR